MIEFYIDLFVFMQYNCFESELFKGDNNGYRKNYEF